MKTIFTLAAGYDWKAADNVQKNHAEKAIKKIFKTVQNKIQSRVDFNKYEFSYRRLRASAGYNMLDSISNRINNAQALIFDLSKNNSNVFLELGMAIQCSRQNPTIKIYLIKEVVKDEDFFKSIPSDLSGFFVSTYEVNKEKEIVFKDGRSLYMSLCSDVLNYLREESNLSEFKSLEKFVNDSELENSNNECNDKI